MKRDGSSLSSVATSSAGWLWRIVAEGNGFRGAIVRAVGVALTTLLPHSSRFEFVSEVESAARLLTPHLASESGGPQRLLGAVEELRARIGAGTARVSAR